MFTDQNGNSKCGVWSNGEIEKKINEDLDLSNNGESNHQSNIIENDIDPE